MDLAPVKWPGFAPAVCCDLPASTNLACAAPSPTASCPFWWLRWHCLRHWPWRAGSVPHRSQGIGSKAPHQHSPSRCRSHGSRQCKAPARDSIASSRCWSTRTALPRHVRLTDRTGRTAPPLAWQWRGTAGLAIAGGDRGASLEYRLELDPLARRLDVAAPGTLVESHGIWIRRLAVLARSLQACSGPALLLVAAVAAAVIAVATRAGLGLRREAIEIVHGLEQQTAISPRASPAASPCWQRPAARRARRAALPVLLTLASFAAPFAGTAQDIASHADVLAALPPCCGSHCRAFRLPQQRSVSQPPREPCVVGCGGCHDGPRLPVRRVTAPDCEGAGRGPCRRSAACGLGFVWFVHLAGRAGLRPRMSTVSWRSPAGQIAWKRHCASLPNGVATSCCSRASAGERNWRELAPRAGIDPTPFAARVTLGRGATTTRGNAQETAAWAKANAIHSLLVVTALPHAPRTGRTGSRAARRDIFSASGPVGRRAGMSPSRCGSSSRNISITSPPGSASRR